MNEAQCKFLVTVVAINALAFAVWWMAGYPAAAIAGGVTAALLTPPLCWKLRTKR